MGRTYSQSFYAFKEWFETAREVPPIKSLAKLYDVEESTIHRWAKKLGGFAVKGPRRRLNQRAKKAAEYMRDCTKPIGYVALMRRVGYCKGTWKAHYGIFLRELAAVAPDVIPKIKKRQRDPNEDGELLSWILSFRNKNKRSPYAREVAERLGRSTKYARRRINELSEARPGAQIKFDPQEEADAEWERMAKRGRRVGLHKYRRSLRGLPGVDFKGEYWDRYLAIWELKRRGYMLREGRVFKVKTRRYVSIEEAMKDEPIN